jgi:hypothetical protein
MSQFSLKHKRGVDEAGRVHANEFLASIAVHGTRRRIGLDHQAGLQIIDD